MPREIYRASARSWMAAARAKHEAGLEFEQRARYQRPLGIDKVITADFETRPKAPANSHRPYVFGSPRARERYTAAVVDIAQRHAELSERFRKGERRLRFPAGTYPPPITLAA